MNKPKLSFIKNAKPKADDRNWCVSVFGWQCAPDGTVSGTVVEAVETNSLGLAILAAHRMLEVHGPQVAELITLEIATASLIDGGKI
jgi:hypothetical protein